MNTRSALVFACGVALGAAGLGLGGALFARRAPAPTASAEPDPSSPAPEARRAASAALPDLRPAIRARVAEVLAEARRGHELDVFLDELARAARERGHVTALEVVPGLAAIDAAYPGDPERGPAFARRMEDLSRGLGEPPPGDEPRNGATAPALLQAIASTPAGPARDKLVPQALAAIGRLPVDQQEEASRALDRATAASAPPAPSAAAPDSLLAQITSTRDPQARHQLVTQFLDAAGQLPPDEQERRFRQLDEATAAR
jgi:hypothetical protein